MVKKAKKSKLASRYAESYNSRNSGGKRAGVIDWKKLDGDVKFFTPKEGRNRINIIPYVIKTKNHPLVRSKSAEVGDLDYVLDVYTHRGVGPTESTVLCLKETYGKPCPVCELMQKLKEEGKDKEAGSLKPSRRVFYNVEDVKDPGTLQVFETSHYLFEKELIDEAREDDGSYTDFADPEDGKEIKFKTSKVQKAGYEFNEFKSFSFEDRDEPLSDELLESAISFDELLNNSSYEEIEKILYGQDDDDDDEPKSKSKSKASDDDDDDEPKSKSKSHGKKK